VPAPPVPAPAPPAAAASGNGTLQTSVPATSYDARRKSAYDELNAARLGAGAGLLAQSAALDTSAADHAAYLTTNGFSSAGSVHDETAGRAGFTGTDPFDRMQAAGFGFSFAAEVIGDIGSPSTTSDCVGDLLDTIYHAADMLSSAQIPASGALIAYPFDGAIVASGTFHVSNETPRAPVALLPNATAGTPILVGFRNQDYVKSHAATIARFTLADASGNLVPGVILADSTVTGAGVNDDAGLDGGVVSGFAVLVPRSPLPPGSYTVTLDASVTGGQALALTTWTFRVVAP
jgi:hypothetical protein